LSVADVDVTSEGAEVTTVGRACAWARAGVSASDALARMTTSSALPWHFEGLAQRVIAPG
jgi:hypothetical protein